MIGRENDMLFSKGTIGNVSTAVPLRRRFITKDMQSETLEKNLSNGSSLFVKLVMTKNIDNKIIKEKAK